MHCLLRPSRPRFGQLPSALSRSNPFANYLHSRPCHPLQISLASNPSPACKVGEAGGRFFEPTVAKWELYSQLLRPGELFRHAETPKGPRGVPTVLGRVHKTVFSHRPAGRLLCLLSAASCRHFLHCRKQRSCQSLVPASNLSSCSPSCCTSAAFHFLLMDFSPQWDCSSG